MEQTPSTTPQPTEQQELQPPENPQPPHVTTVPQTTSTTSSPNPNPTAITSPAPRPPITHQPPTRPSFNTRPWQQPPPSHFSLPSPPLPSSPAPTSSISITPRGGMAIGVPAHHPSPIQPPPASFASLTPPSYGTQQSHIRQPMQGMGMAGTLGTASLRPGGVSASQLRPSQSSLRPQTGPNSQSPASQNFQGHGMLRVSALGSSVSPSPNSSQNQPWLSPGTQGKPPLPTPSSLRPQTSPQSFQQRSHVPQQLPHNTPTTTQQPINSSHLSSQPSSLTSAQPHDHYGPQFPPPRTQQSISHQQQITRAPPASGSQRSPLGMPQSGSLLTGAPNKTAVAENEESSNRIVNKRSIQDLLNQIDPSEKFDPEVENILVDIAEDFVESITTFGCSLAKHRKSSTLEAKDILLHLERNWNMTLPGFGGDEIKTYKKPVVSDVHRERISAIKRSTVATDPTATTKNLGGQSGGSTKTHLAKGPAASAEAA